MLILVVFQTWIWLLLCLWSTGGYFHLSPRWKHPWRDDGDALAGYAI